MELTSKRRAYLRKKAHDLDALVRIGKEGVTDNLIQSILDAIESRELIKVKILQNCEEEKMEIMECNIPGTWKMEAESYIIYVTFCDSLEA